MRLTYNPSGPEPHHAARDECIHQMEKRDSAGANKITLLKWILILLYNIICLLLVSLFTTAHLEHLEPP